MTHGHLMEGKTVPLCENCFVPISILHILTECPDFSDERLRYFRRNGIDQQISLYDMLKDDTNVIENLFKFITDIGILSKL